MNKHEVFSLLGTSGYILFLQTWNQLFHVSRPSGIQMIDVNNTNSTASLNCDRSDIITDLHAEFCVLTSHWRQRSSWTDDGRRLSLLIHHLCFPTCFPSALKHVCGCSFSTGQEIPVSIHKSLLQRRGWNEKLDRKLQPQRGSVSASYLERRGGGASAQ